MKKSKHLSELSEIDKLVYTDTDISSFFYLYEKIGIELSVEEFKNNTDGNEKYYIIMEEGEASFIGYGSFYSCITFDKNGKFISQWFYE